MLDKHIEGLTRVVISYEIYETEIYEIEIYETSRDKHV